ncbi:hypothetical protein Pmani_023064 [Petrolisthes manimaculis]|uniref:Uncharacterized protein n=1 Tax=Petrolisthes manimaculis TaxID=1843537 RepID=A0AAE1PAP9_9EUCA|nr:hypothetical protein Pmani_023064 [Petrolisthes manimaculis]
MTDDQGRGRDGMRMDEERTSVHDILTGVYTTQMLLMAVLGMKEMREKLSISLLSLPPTSHLFSLPWWSVAVLQEGEVCDRSGGLQVVVAGAPQPQHPAFTTVIPFFGWKS